MKQIEYTVTKNGGIHARIAGQMVALARGFACETHISRGGDRGDLKRPMDLLGLGVQQGQRVTIQADGPDEEQCIAGFEAFLQENV